MQMKKKTFVNNFNDCAIQHKLGNLRSKSQHYSMKQVDRFLGGNLDTLCKDTLINTDYQHLRNKSDLKEIIN